MDTFLWSESCKMSALTRWTFLTWEFQHSLRLWRLRYAFSSLDKQLNTLPKERLLYTADACSEDELPCQGLGRASLCFRPASSRNSSRVGLGPKLRPHICKAGCCKRHYRLSQRLAIFVFHHQPSEPLP